MSLLPAKAHLSGIGLNQPVEQFQGCGLAASRRPDQGQGLAGLQVEGNAIDGALAAKGFRQIARRQKNDSFPVLARFGLSL